MGWIICNRPTLHIGQGGPENRKCLVSLLHKHAPVPNDQLNISVKFHENQMIFRGRSQNALFSPREQVKIERKYDKCRLLIVHINLGHICNYRHLSQSNIAFQDEYQYFCILGFELNCCKDTGHMTISDVRGIRDRIIQRNWRVINWIW